MSRNVRLKHRKGSLFISTIAIVSFLILTSMAFMMWAADEKQQAQFDLARTQAYYVAQYGVLNEALATMRNRSAETLPPGVEPLYSGSYLNQENELVGEYYEVSLSRVSDMYFQGLFQSSFHYDLQATGKVALGQGNPHWDGAGSVERTVTMRTRLRTYASYMYLTNEEQTMFGEIIWFWTPDTLYGRVHSNSGIGIKYAPQFHGPVSTTEEDFIHGAGYSPWFAYDPQFSVEEVYFPTTADNLRGGASASGNYITNHNGSWRSRLTAQNGSFLLEQWENGAPYDSTALTNHQGISYGSNMGIFVEGDCELIGCNSDNGQGIMNGQMTIGSSGHLELLDNVLIAPYTANSLPETIPETDYNIIGLISESNVRIRDTWRNGRGNGLARTNGIHDSCHIIITAAIVALGESFTFEHQNDTWEAYRWCDPLGAHPNQPDERGSIFLRGSVTQMRRGYVHRSTCGGTGYAKDYYYDWRLESTPPPYYMEATDENGNSLFDIIAWREEIPASAR